MITGIRMIVLVLLGMCMHSRCSQGNVGRKVQWAEYEIALLFNGVYAFTFSRSVGFAYRQALLEVRTRKQEHELKKEALRTCSYAFFTDYTNTVTSWVKDPCMMEAFSTIVVEKICDAMQKKEKNKPVTVVSIGSGRLFTDLLVVVRSLHATSGCARPLHLYCIDQYGSQNLQRRSTEMLYAGDQLLKWVKKRFPNRTFCMKMKCIDDTKSIPADVVYARDGKLNGALTEFYTTYVSRIQKQNKEVIGIWVGPKESDFACSVRSTRAG